MKGDGTGDTGEGSPEQPRSIAFHWLANIILASLALFAGVVFGEKIPREQMGVAFVAVAAVALALVPLTRYWEKSGIEGRRKAAEQAKDAAKPGGRLPDESKPDESKPDKERPGD